MPGFKGRGFAAEDFVFDRPAAQRNERVDAARVGFEHRLGLVAEQGKVAARGGGAVHLTGNDVAGDGARAEPFGVAAGAAPQQRFHLPEPVLRLRKAEPGKRIPIGSAADMRNAPGIAPDIDIAEQPLHLCGADMVRQMIGRIDLGGGCGHRALPSFSLLLLRIIIRVRSSKAMPDDRRRDGRRRFPAASAARRGSDRSPADSAWRRRSRAAD